MKEQETKSRLVELVAQASYESVRKHNHFIPEWEEASEDDPRKRRALRNAEQWIAANGDVVAELIHHGRVDLSLPTTKRLGTELRMCIEDDYATRTVHIPRELALSLYHAITGKPYISRGQHGIQP